ncbi:MAG: hypothetical protein IPM23_11580 [Candidatus Melainabacteria bacterium]|nr:hypothetical protein [Candidatus Melainabacteria bacterium]
MFELNATIVLFVLSFLLFIKLLDSLYLQPVGTVIEERKNRIDTDNSAAQELARQSAREVEKYEEKLVAIREEAQKVINEAVTAAQSKRSDLLASVADSGRKKLDKAKLDLEAEHKSLVKSLVEEEMALVGDIVAKLVDRTASVSLDATAVERRLEEAR